MCDVAGLGPGACVGVIGMSWSVRSDTASVRYRTSARYVHRWRVVLAWRGTANRCTVQSGRAHPRLGGRKAPGPEASMTHWFLFTDWRRVDRVAEDKADAIDVASELYFEYLSDAERVRLRDDLDRYGLHWFEVPSVTSAEYCGILDRPGTLRAYWRSEDT